MHACMHAVYPILYATHLILILRELILHMLCCEMESVGQCEREQGVYLNAPLLDDRYYVSKGVYSVFPKVMAIRIFFMDVCLKL